MITKLIALLTLLFAPLHISNNIAKDGAWKRDEVSLSRPQKTTLRAIKNSRDYNEYYSNNSFNIITNFSSTKDNYLFSANSTTNIMTFTGDLGTNTKQINYEFDTSNILLNSKTSFYYVKLEIFTGDYSPNTEIFIQFYDADIKDYINLTIGLNQPYLLISNGYKDGNYKIKQIGIRGSGFYNNFTFSFYIFSPQNNNNYVPYGDIYTGIQVDDDFYEYRESEYKNSYPLYGGKVTYVDDNETYLLNNFQPTNLNNVTYQEMYNYIDPSIETWNNTCTLTFDFNASISAGDLILYSFMFNKIQIYQSNGDLFYEHDYGYHTTGFFDISSLSLNDTQKNQFINKVVLTFTNGSYHPTMQKILLRAENKVNSSSYEYGYDKGLKEGEQIGYNNGLDVGNTQGYNRGYEDGRNENIANKNYNVFTLVSSAFSSVGQLLNVEIYNGLTIGVIVCIPIIFCVVLFVIKMIKG